MRNVHTSRSSSSRDPPAAPSASSSAARMPYDRGAPANSAAAASASRQQQPQMPTLAKRASAVAPKLAARSTPTPTATPTPSSTSTSMLTPQRQTVTLAAPHSRRTARPESAASQATSSHLSVASAKRNSGGTSRDRDWDGYASPIARTRQSNATPRSGSRQGRVNSAHSSSSSPTPTDLPIDHWETRSGLGILSPALEPEGARKNGPSAAQRDSKFFYASEAPKPPPAPTSQPRAPAAQLKGTTFFYANGSNAPPKPSANHAPTSPRLPACSTTPDPLASKFMYANGAPDLQPSLMASSGSASVVSTSSRVPPSRGPQSPALLAQKAPSIPPRPSSHPPPPASTAQPVPTTIHTSSGPSIAERRSIVASAPQLNTNLRRISSDPPSTRISSAHSRAGSLVGSLVNEPPSANRTLPTSPPATTPLPSPLSFNNPGLSMASVLQAAESLADHDHDHDHDDDDESMVSGLTSPQSANGNDPLNELVANARRERKVQDLQITNASLEAINRTLERQLRKQTNELRRYKRMARAGRLSSANTAPSSRTVSGCTAESDTPEGPLNHLSLSDLSEQDSDTVEDEEIDSFESDLSESASTGSARTSPSALATRDARHRRRDEKRLQVDLSKHQQLLVDSQKMNQSLKRCLGWTEELIRDGKRALAYQVRVNEVDVGGRATPEDGEQPYIYDGAKLWDHAGQAQLSDVEDDDDFSADGEDGPEGGDADETMRLRIERLRPAEELDGHNKSAQDRDSGIVLGDAT